MGSLMRNQKRITGQTAPTEPKLDEKREENSDPPVPPWKKDLAAKRNNSKSMKSTVGV